jgi:SAM-dependent methyltransferase
LTNVDGIWFSGAVPCVSYPQEGYDYCFALEEDSFWFQHRNRCILAALKRFPSDGPFFDVGGGNGFVAKRLQDEGLDVYLIEPGSHGAMHARQRGIKKIICATLEESGLPKGSAAGIGLFDVLEHLEQDNPFLSMLRTFLRPSGRLYLTVPAYNWLWSAEDSWAGHLRRYSCAMLREQLERLGWHVEYATYFFSLLPLPIFAFRTMPTRCKRKAGHSEVVKGRGAHLQRQIKLRGAVERLLSWEITLIHRQCKIPFGSSILMIARGVSS